MSSLVEKFEADQYICKEGDVGHDMYIIKSGKVNVIKEMGDEAIILTSLGRNDFFGEMALFGISKRTATVKTITDTEIIIVTRRMLETQFKKVPDWLVTMIKTIAKRIISTSKGVDVRYKVSIEYSILTTVKLLGQMYGNPTERGYMIPLDLARDELTYITGISKQDVDIWLKRFGLVNLVKILGGKSMLEIPHSERLDQFMEYIYARSPEGDPKKLSLPPDTIKSFERIDKLLNR